MTNGLSTTGTMNSRYAPTVKKLLKRFLFRRRFSIQFRLGLIRTRKLYEMLSSSSNFPNSLMLPKRAVFQTLKGFEDSISLLLSLSRNGNSLLSSGRLFLSENALSISKDLKSSFDFYQSDKSSFHKYHLVYALILEHLVSQFEDFSIFEVGIGTNDPLVPSSMGVNGKPGASLKGFADIKFINRVIGADIDANILFRTSKVETYQLDQTNKESWNKFHNEVSLEDCKLVIDDGLHAPFANFRTIQNCLSVVENGGIIVIEDVSANHLPIWRIFQELSIGGSTSVIIQDSQSYLVVIGKDLTFFKNDSDHFQTLEPLEANIASPSLS